VDHGGLGRLRLGRKALDSFLGGGQGFGIQVGGNFVALAACIAVALGSSEREPFIGFRDVFFCSETTCGQYAEIILTVGYAMLCALSEPLCRAGIVRLSVGSLCIKDSQVMHCLGVAFAGGGHVEFLGSDEILFYPLALFEHACIAELGRRQALARGTL